MRNITITVPDDTGTDGSQPLQRFFANLAVKLWIPI
jgi:hypothetical protein